MRNLIERDWNKMTIADIFSNKFLFEANPTPKSPYYLLLTIIFGVILITAIILAFLKRLDRKIRYRNLYCYMTCGVLGFLYLFARYEQLPWLGSRLFLAIILLALVIWIGINTIWMLDYSKELRSKHVLKNRYEKYLPKAKK